MLYLCAAIVILIMSLFRFSAYLPFVGIFHVCRNGFPRAWSHVLIGAEVSTIGSVTIAIWGVMGGSQGRL